MVNIDPRKLAVICAVCMQIQYDIWKILLECFYLYLNLLDKNGLFSSNNDSHGVEKAIDFYKCVIL